MPSPQPQQQPGGVSATDLLQQFGGGAAAGGQLPQQQQAPLPPPPPPPGEGDVNLQLPAEQAVVGAVIQVANGLRLVIVEIIGQPGPDGKVGVRATPVGQQGQGGQQVGQGGQ